MSDKRPTLSKGRTTGVGEEDDAFAEAARGILPPLESSTLRQAADALAGNRIELAEKLVSPFLKKHPANVSALNLMADIARRAERFDEAEKLLFRCIEQSQYPGYRFNYAVMLRRNDKFDEALAQLEELLAKDPQNPLYRNQKAKVLSVMGRYEDALACLRRLSEEYPALPAIWLNFGDALKKAGRLDECVTAYRKAADLVPDSGGYPRLAELKTYRFTVNDIEWLETQLSLPNLSANDRAYLHFALAQARGQQQLYAKSFNHYLKANALFRLNADADPEKLSRYRSNCQSLFTKEFFRERARWGCASDGPIFIVGLPRSGSTLLEQLLCSHSAIEALGELSDLDCTINEWLDCADRQDRPPPDYIRLLGDLDAEQLRSLGERYLASTMRRRKQGRPYFTDKTLSNFVHLAFIQLTLPNAKIIDIRRHPLDCGWSCFKSDFPTGQAFSHKLSDIGYHYADYVRLMAHFDRVLPGRIHRIIYEDLIGKPEIESRRLFEYLELPFEEQCLQFHRNTRGVRTLSAEQVRQPLYSSGIGQWKAYESWLGPLKTALGVVLESYPNAPE